MSLLAGGSQVDGDKYENLTLPTTTMKSEACQPEHCYHAFDALYCALTDTDPIPPSFENIAYPLFVSWHIRSSRFSLSGHTRLRGCIGTFEPLPIREGLTEYALISAFNDTRFRKIEERELSKLECGISLLTDFEDVDSYLDWTIGVHGIHITFSHPSSILSITSPSSTPSPLSSSSNLLSSRFRSSRRSFSATYLPEVMPEQGWTKVEAIDNAIHKAGWDGQITEDLRRSIKLRRYQSSKCDVSFADYYSWRKSRLEADASQ